MICEVPPLALLPNFIVQHKVLKPMRIQTGGSILVKYKIHLELYVCVMTGKNSDLS